MSRLQTNRPIFGLYVRIDVRVRSPKRWGWSIHREGTDVTVATSDLLFSHADDAWKAGQVALAALAPCLLPPCPRDEDEEWECEAEDHMVEMA